MRALCLALVALGLLAGLAWSLAQPPTYSATASVALAPVPVYATSSTTELAPPAVSIDTDAQLLRSPRVLRASGDALGVDAAAASEHLRVTATPSSSVLHVTLTAASAQEAADAANAAVAAFVDERREALGALRLDQLRQLRLLISTREGLLAQEQRRRLVIPARDDMFDELLQLRTGLRELEEAREQPASVLQPARPPGDADYANAEVPTTSAAMAGLIAACLWGVARDRRRPVGDRATSTPTHRRLSGPLPAIRTTHGEYHHAT
jgi:uncharacterized protein involved in exopolysaccharide biosynthesis